MSAGNKKFKELFTSLQLEEVSAQASKILGVVSAGRATAQGTSCRVVVPPPRQKSSAHCHLTAHLKK